MESEYEPNMLYDEFLNEFKKPHMSVSDRSVQFLYRVYYFASVALLSMATFKGRSDPTA